MSKVERTAPGSKLRFRVTYDSGSKKWTNDRPGDGKGDQRKRRKLFDDLTVKRGIERLEKAIGAYASGDGSADAVRNAVDEFEQYAGDEDALTAIRAVYKAVSGEGGKLQEGAGIAKEHAGMNRKRDSGGLESMKVGSEILRIARELVAEDKLTIDQMSALVRANRREVLRILLMKFREYLDENIGEIGSVEAELEEGREIKLKDVQSRYATVRGNSFSLGIKVWNTFWKSIKWSGKLEQLSGADGASLDRVEWPTNEVNAVLRRFKGTEMLEVKVDGETHRVPFDVNYVWDFKRSEVVASFTLPESSVKRIIDEASANGGSVNEAEMVKQIREQFAQVVSGMYEGEDFFMDVTWDWYSGSRQTRMEPGEPAGPTNIKWGKNDLVRKVKVTDILSKMALSDEIGDVEDPERLMGMALKGYGTFLVEEVELDMGKITASPPMRVTPKVKGKEVELAFESVRDLEEYIMENAEAPDGPEYDKYEND